MIRIIGAKGDIENTDQFLKKINDLSKKHKIVIQVLDANMVYGKKHLISASRHAIRAIRRKKNSTNSLPMEILLYASGERQIRLSIQKMGIKTGKKKPIALVFIDNITDLPEANGKISDQNIDEIIKQIGITRNDNVLKGNIETLKKFGINENAIKTVVKDKYEDLILEKVALVDIIK